MDKFQELELRHPCFSKKAHFNKGRIHLPVSPICNIQCKFCKRGFNKFEERPGVTRKILKPEESVEIVRKALELCPEISVVGIAGPGDTLATDDAVNTFAAIGKEFPELISCLSTNGLELYNKAEAIANAGVKTLTVTVNSVNPKTQKDIISYINVNGKKVIGEEAARILIDAQLRGIKKISELGVVVKINTVLIPGLNDGEIEEIAKATADRGASIINIIPLIPQNEFSDHRRPTCEEIEKARSDAEKYLKVFKHCKHCRADACGIPGKGVDISKLLYDIQVEETFSHG